MKLFYVAPKIPSLSTVFELNEILGLQQNHVDVSLFSCRNVSLENREGQKHKFAEKVYDKTLYTSYILIVPGLIWVIKNKTITLLKLISYVLTSLTENIYCFPKVFIALIIAISLYPRCIEKQISWIHADFGKNTATVAFFLSQLLDCPFSYKIHAFEIFDQRAKFIDPLERLKVDNATLIFSAHNYGKKVLEGKYSNIEEKVKVNYVSIRPDSFRLLPPQISSKRFVALGRLIHTKGFHILIKAASILLYQQKDFIVDIYGSGTDEEVLRNLIKNNKLEKIVNLQGYYDNDKLPDMLLDSLAVVAPSIVDENGDMDGIPTVLFESMALGRAVIASEISGIPEVVNNDVNGYLFESGNEIELAQKMSILLDNPEKAYLMGKEGRLWVEKNHNYIENAKELINSIKSQIK